MSLPQLPESIHRLDEVSRNLWWSWSPEARAVFRAMSVRLWRETDHNPVKMLSLITDGQLQRLAEDHDFLKLYHRLIKSFDRYKGEQPEEFEGTRVAYFSAEYGLHGSLPIYSGGLGILAGDHCKSASDLAVDLTAIGFMYPRGYFEQEIARDGDQIPHYEELNIPNVAIEPALLKSGEVVRVSLPLTSPDDLLHLQVWLVRCGRNKIYLMDSNVPENAPHNRDITARLYGGDREYRLRQEIALGIGGVRVVRALGLEPNVWHANEGHVAFMFLERMRELVKAGASFAEAKANVQASSIFTTHTPVPAGHDAFALDLMERYFWHYWEDMEISKEEFLSLGTHEGSFNMTVLCLNLAAQRNAVSKKHGEVTREMWPEFVSQGTNEELGMRNEAKQSSKKKSTLHSSLLIPHSLTSITNGVHTRTWLAPEMEELFNRTMGKDWPEHLDDDKYWEAFRSISDEAMWQTRQQLKMSLMSFLTDRARRKWLAQHEADLPANIFVSRGTMLDPSILTIGFARRFATYKRATLIFRDLERLKAMLWDPMRPVQFVFSGKAHPADEGGKQLIREIWQHALDPAFGGRIAFLENYSMHVAKYLVQGVDVWMNNPKAPLEASGTSGMKAAINGVPNFSVLDGWWIEGWNGKNGWGIEGATEGTDEEQDTIDAVKMYEVLEKDIIPAFYDKQSDGIPHRWMQIAKESVATILPRFSSERMVREYAERLYRSAR